MNPPAPRSAPPAPLKSAPRKSLFSAIGETKGQRIVFYGTGGIGKSTLACQLPGKSAFVDLDESLPILKGQLKAAGITLPQVVNAGSWSEVRSALQSPDWGGIDNIVVDTGTKLEELAVAHTLRMVTKEGGKKADGVEDYGYGKGFQFVFDTFLPILGDFDRHIREGRNVVIICHECTTKVPNPNGEDWLRYEPRLQSPASGKASIRYRLKEWSDHVLFLTYDVVTEKKSKVGQGSGTRTLYTSELPAFMAKSRTTNESFTVDGNFNWNNILK